MTIAHWCRQEVIPLSEQSGLVGRGQRAGWGQWWWVKWAQLELHMVRVTRSDNFILISDTFLRHKQRGLWGSLLLVSDNIVDIEIKMQRTLLSLPLLFSTVASFRVVKQTQTAEVKLYIRDSEMLSTFHPCLETLPRWLSDADLQDWRLLRVLLLETLGQWAGAQGVSLRVEEETCGLCPDQWEN